MRLTQRPLATTLHLLLALLLLASGAAATAQFNGPALPPLAGPNRPVPITTDPAILFPAQHDMRLSPGDGLTVRVYGPGEYYPTVRIAIDGTVQLPLIGVVKLAGLTVFEAETLIAQKLQDAGMFRNPQVTIAVTEGPGATVTVVGETHGVVPILGQRRLLDVLAAAGGLPATASHIITIDRPGQPQPIVVDLGTDPGRSALADVPIFAGDTIVVSRVGVVYLIGAFKTPGSVPVVGNSPLTLLQVTALAGGTTFAGDFKDLRIIRTVGSERTMVKVDVKKVLYGRAPDPVLQADDIIFLPPSTLKNLITSNAVGTLLGITSLVITLTRY